MSTQTHRAEAPPARATPGSTTARSRLLHDGSVERYRRVLVDGVDRVARRVAAVDRPFTGVAPAELAPLVARIDLDRPLGDPSLALDELDGVYLRDAVWFHHPRYLAHLNCPVAIPALLGDAVLSAVDPSLDTWDQSAGDPPVRTGPGPARGDPPGRRATGCRAEGSDRRWLPRRHGLW